MSEFEGRRELGEAAHQAIDLAADDVRNLVNTVSARDDGGRSPAEAIATLLEDYAFDVEWDYRGLPGAFLAQARRWNAEDMRKGLRHGHVAFVASYGTPADDARSEQIPLVVGSAVAGAIGLAATLVRMHGTVSLIGVPREEDLPLLAAAGAFESPDCALAAFPSSTGYGYQHTINQSGETLAGMRLDVTFSAGTETRIHELQAAVGSIIDDRADYAIARTDTGFDLTARRAAMVEELADRISALARARAESDGVPVNVERSALLVDMQPSRILARRIKTFAGWLKMRQDRIKKEPAGPPSPWGSVSHVTPTALAGFPVDAHPATSVGDDAHAQMCLIAKATASAGLDVLGDMEFRGFAEGEFIRGLRERDIHREPRRWLGVHPVLPREGSSPRRVNLPDVIVRGPGLPEPTIEDFLDDEDE